MKIGVIAFGFALIAVAVQGAAHAQAINPAQAAAIAQGVVGLIFGVMNPTPQCGPHDAIPRPYQPQTPNYSQPQPSQPMPYPGSELSDDDDDDDIQPVHRPAVRHPLTYSSQPQTGADETQDDSSQAAETQATGPSATAKARRRPVQEESAQDTGSMQSGQVVEIPSQPAARVYQGGQSAVAPPSDHDSAADP